MDLLDGAATAAAEAVAEATIGRFQQADSKSRCSAAGGDHALSDDKKVIQLQPGSSSGPHDTL